MLWLYTTFLETVTFCLILLDHDESFFWRCCTPAYPLSRPLSTLAYVALIPRQILVFVLTFTQNFKPSRLLDRMRRISRQEYLDFSNHLRLRLQASTQNFAPDEEIISTRDLPPLSAGGIHVTHSRQPSVVDVQSLRDSSVFSPVSFASTTTSPLSSSYPLARQLISPVSQSQTPFESPNSQHHNLRN
jgi:hypothetical protein